MLARRSRRLANRRKDRTHQVTARLVREHAMIVTEDLSVRNMTASAKGTVEAPGRRVKQKAGLNRAILDTAPGSFLSNLRIKAEEAGCVLVLVDPRKYKPSQTCPVSGEVRQKGLSERTPHLAGRARDFARSGVGVGALEYRSGTGHGCEPGNRTQSRASGLTAVVHAWHGYRIPDTHHWIIADKARLTVQAAMAERNAELRRIMLEIVGFERVAAELGAAVVDQDVNCGQPRRLLRAEVGGETLAILHVVNGSLEPNGTRREFHLGALSEARTCHEAVAMSYGRAPHSYREAGRT